MRRVGRFNASKRALWSGGAKHHWHLSDSKLRSINKIYYRIENEKVGTNVGDAVPAQRLPHSGYQLCRRDKNS